MIKKCISVIIIFILLFNSEGYYLWFRRLQHNIQKEIKNEIRKNRLKDEDLTLIIVPLNDESSICWIKPKKEFRYQGEMYDVVKTKIQNQQKYYYCINDKKETHLIANFHENQKSKKNSAKRLKRTLNHIYFHQQIVFKNSVYTSDIHYTSIENIYISILTDIPSPPPKLFQFLA